MDSNPYESPKYDLWSFHPVAEYVTGMTNQAIKINANQYLISNVNFPFQFPMTFACWFKLDDIQASTHRLLFAIGANFYITILPYSNQIHITVPNMSVPITASFTFNYVFNAGYHLVLIIEAVGTVKLYINAELLSISIIDPNYPLIYSQIPVGQLYIGGSASNSNYLLGFVDEFHVFHKELSINEINQLYNCTYHSVRSQYNISFASGTLLQVNDGIEQYASGNYKINLGLSSTIIGLQNQPHLLNNSPGFFLTTE